jgi:hypothetical protein
LATNWTLPKAARMDWAANAEMQTDKEGR